MLCPPSTQFKVFENPAVFYINQEHNELAFVACKRHHGRECGGMSMDFQTFCHSFGCSRSESLLGIGRIRSCLSQMHQKDVTPDEKQELDEALQREVYPWIESPPMPTVGCT